MLSTFLDKAESLLNRRFVVAYWLPTLMIALTGVLLRVVVVGWAGVMQDWRGMVVEGDASAQLWAMLLFLMGVTLVAYLLQAFTRLLVRTLEGYGRLWPGWLRTRRVRVQARRMAALRDRIVHGTRWERAAAQDTLVHHFPLKGPFQGWGEVTLLPTRLGNTLRSAESYGLARYGMDLPFWWSRLWPLLPEEERTLVENGLMGMISMLSLALLLLYNGVDGLLYLVRGVPGWSKLWGAAYLVGCWSLAWLCYEGAIVQARSYGQRLRAAVDLHRFALLEALHQPLPPTPLAERDLWKWLTEWAYSGAAGPAFAKSYDHGDGPETEGEEEPEDEQGVGWLTRVVRCLFDGGA